MRLFSTTAFLILVAASLALAQIDSASPSQNTVAPHNEKPNASLPDEGLTIKVHANLVQLRVVVRDRDGRAVENLGKEDFQIYDAGKLQTVTAFAVETPESRRKKGATAAGTEDRKAVSSGPIAAAVPDRFVAIVFDDTHFSLQDTLRVKAAAQLFLQGLAQRDRAGIYSTSGQLTQEFTADSAALQHAVSRVSPRPLAFTNDRDCPNVTYSLADRIENHHETEALDAVIQETLICAFAGDRRNMPYAQTMAESAIHQALRAGDAETGFAFRHLEDAVRRLEAMPGERVLLLVSPGFLFSRRVLDETKMAEEANRANIVINALDVRGLYVPSGAENISKRVADIMETGDIKSSDRLETQLRQSEVLADLAGATGGTFFHNSNDLAGGLKMAGSPEICYVLGFAPRDLKPDGHYHSIEVKLSGKQKYSVQARHGYYAPRKLSPKEQEDQDIGDDLYSREESGNLFVDVKAQSLAHGKEQVRLMLISQVAVKNIHFRRVDGKNSDVLRMVTAIFDDNGNFVTGGEKVLTMDLDDDAYERLSRTGLPVNLSFDLKPGRYLVRQLLRDADDGRIAARNRAVEITN